MLEESNRCLFVGLPNSGKSSFIGALWHVVESGEINSLYSVKVQPEDREYLNRLRSSFLDCVPVERTKTEFVKKIELDIIENSSGKVINFTFPDLSGETFESQFEYRKLTSDYLNQIRECNSLMLFINPDFLKKANLISQVDEFFKPSSPALVFPNNGGSKEAVSEPSKADDVKWAPKHCQSQVVLVDLLQMIRDSLRTPCKINVIISAWDQIKSLPGADGEITPEAWLTEQLPLLYQYLLCNKRKHPFVAYGISAQGGAYSDIPDENINLQIKLKQSERIIVQSGDVIHNDITLPLKWIFNE